jgi:MOSC domain-containing protein YiiM
VDARCEQCGYAREDYRAAWDRKWLERAVPERVRLMFEGLPEGTELPGMGNEEKIGEALTRLTEHDDLHPAVHLTQTAARAAAALAPRKLDGAEGRLVQVSVSPGGVPKLAVTEAAVSWRGLVGDAQRERKHHGHAWQALCLWSAEVVRVLQVEGHPIDFGSAGENFTIRGLDWKRMRSGVRLEAGTALCEVTAPAAPCHHNARWFADGNPKRMDHDLNPGYSRWYAAVLRPGVARPGDVVRVLPSSIDD